jgi:hypothetical protein
MFSSKPARASKAKRAVRKQALDAKIALFPRAPASQGTCRVCESSVEELLPTTTVQGAVCKHAFCRDCWVSWISAKVADQHRIIPCLEPGCKCNLAAEDVARVSTPELAERHAHLLEATHQDAAAAMAANPSLAAAVQSGEVRPCPHCHVMVARDTGCNAMTCVCGQRFCFCCGHERCVKTNEKLRLLVRQQQLLWMLAEQRRAQKQPCAV